MMATVTQLKRKFKSKKTQKTVEDLVDGVAGDVFVFISSLEELNRNTLYLMEFGYDYILEEFDEENFLVLTAMDDECMDIVDKDDSVLMFSLLRTSIDSMFIYSNGKKQEASFK